MIAAILHGCDIDMQYPAVCNVDTHYEYSIHRTMIVAGTILNRSPSEMVFVTQAVSLTHLSMELNH